MVAVFAAVWILSRWDARVAYRLLEYSEMFFEPEQTMEDASKPSGISTANKALQTGRYVFKDPNGGKGAGSRHERRVTPLMKKKIGEAYDWRCACCGKKLTFDYHVDHIVPLWRGGTNHESNLQPLNPQCHVIKTSFENQL